jgi:hypothetical protein
LPSTWLSVQLQVGNGGSPAQSQKLGLGLPCGAEPQPAIARSDQGASSIAGSGSKAMPLWDAEQPRDIEPGYRRSKTRARTWSSEVAAGVQPCDRRCAALARIRPTCDPHPSVGRSRPMRSLTGAYPNRPISVVCSPLPWIHSQATRIIGPHAVHRQSASGQTGRPTFRR